MTTITVKVPEDLNHRLEFIAKKRGTNKSEVVRRSLEQTLNGTSSKDELSCYDLVKDLIGSIKGGPRDLATNPKYMKGFGQ